MRTVRGDRTVTITFEGIDSRGEAFMFSRTVPATGFGYDQRDHARQLREAADRALDALEASVEALYGGSSEPQLAPARA